MRKKLNKTLGILFLFLTLICTNINILNFTLASLTKQDQILINANTLNEEKETTRNLIALNTNKISFKNLAIFIKFNDSDTLNTVHIDDETSIQNAEKIFNSNGFEMDTINGLINVPSFKSYYEKQSYGKLSINTEFFPKINGKVVSYEDPHPIGYYLKYNDNNPIGYKDKTESLKRETELINNAVKYVKENIQNSGITASELDTDGDGVIDAISFIVEGSDSTKLPSVVGWNDLLWSHKMDSEGITETILGKRVKAYNLLYAEDYTKSASLLSLNRGTYGTILHEFGHTLGYKDLYRYGSQSKPVGFYDLMGNVIGSNPQDLLTYFISEYHPKTNWHTPLEVINKTTNNITLYKPEYIDESEKRAIKVQISGKNDEYFIVEYHERKNTYSTSSADSSGIIVYRVNENNKYQGSAGGVEGKGDHIFIFRPNEISLGDGNGELSKATLNKARPKLGKDRNNDKTFDNETIYYSDGSNSGIVIEVTGETTNSVTFNVTFPTLDGSGTEIDPYLIYDIDTYIYLLSLDTKNKYYKLMNDLDFKNITNYPKINFDGNFDGNNKTLKNITAEDSGVFNSINFFNYDKRTTIQNLNIENITVTSTKGNYLGALASSSENVTIKNVHIKNGKVTNIESNIGDEVSTGGFIGDTESSTTIENSSANVNVSAPKNVGGFIGRNKGATIKNSFSTSTVTGNEKVGLFIALQCIMGNSYNIPVNTYYKYENDTQKAVGGYSAFHNQNALNENSLDKGLTGVMVPENLTLKTNEKTNLTLTTKPNVTVQSQISVLDNSIAKNNNNEITALKNGTTEAYTNLTVGSIIMRLTTKITVTNDAAIEIPIDNIQFNEKNITLEEGNTKELKVTFNPTNNTMSELLTWETSDKNIVTVDALGKITAIKKGTATIKATTINGKTAEITITVKEKSPLTEEEVLNHFGLQKKGNYVVGFNLGANVQEIRNKLSNFNGVLLTNFKNKNGMEIASGIISTGMTFTLHYNNTDYNYTVVIKGDVNGDGYIYATDYVQIKNHIMGKTSLKGAYLLAADIDNDNNIYATDYVKIKNYIMGKGTIAQKLK